MSASLDGKSILIVDDDPDVLAAIEVSLQPSGATLLRATDGDKALELVWQSSPDLVILDAMLPKRSGLLVLEKLKPGKKRGQKPFVIMITANEGKRHQDWAMSMGADAYLNKPFRMDRLIGAVEKLLVDVHTEPPP